MENNKNFGAVERLSIYSFLIGVVVLFVFIAAFVMGAAFSGGANVTGLILSAIVLFIVGSIFFKCSQRLRNNKDNPQKLKTPAIFLLVLSVVILFFLIVKLPRMVEGESIGMGPFGIAANLVALLTLIDSIKVLRISKK
mgnify:CR=1 FL=1